MDAPGSSRSGALPLEHSSFLDRRTQLAAARAMLGETRLLTVLGPAGVGKTRFAIRLARSISRGYPGGVWFIDLTRVGATGSVAGEVGQTLGLTANLGADNEELIRSFGTQRGLLVLDNCEHVIEQCARLVRLLLDAHPELTVLATSRAALRVSPERVFLMEPLETRRDRESESPASMLFLERCAAVLPDPSAADRQAIDEICRRLDGLPLAIELAATRVNVLAPTQLLARLSEPLPLLTGGGRDAPDRQQTLRAAIKWSYDLCTPVERLVWRQMSVFRGGWDLGAVEWMSAGLLEGESAVDVVQSLLEKSIVVRRQSRDLVYYDMLDVVRAFGVDASTPGDLEQFRIRHRDRCIDRLAALEADWFGPNQAYWLAFVRRELPNLRAALEFCLDEGDAAHAATLLMCAMRPVWQITAGSEEGRQWLDRLVAVGTPPTPDVCLAVCMLGTLEIVYGDPEEGRRWHALGRELLEQVDDERTRGVFADFVAMSVGRDPEKAATANAEALASHGGRDAVTARAHIEMYLATQHDRAGHLEIARRLRETLIARGVEAGDSFETGMMLLEAGLSATQRGDADQATKLLRQSLSLDLNLDSPDALERCIEGLAWAAWSGKDPTRAATLLGLIRPGGDPRGALYVASPYSRPFRSELEAEVRGMLGGRSYGAAVAAGRAMTEAEGIAYALGAQLPSPRSRSEKTKDGVLTPREGQVASLVGQGLTDREIAARLVISKRTAEGHVANSLQKLGFTTRAQLAVWAGQPVAS